MMRNATIQIIKSDFWDFLFVNNGLMLHIRLGVNHILASYLLHSQNVKFNVQNVKLRLKEQKTLMF